MKKLIIIIALAIVAYIVYINFIAPPAEKAADKVEETIFEKPYAQTKAAKRTEAKQMAQVLMNKQHEYFVINGRYAANIKDLAFVPRIGQKYKAAVISADENDFLIQIRGNIDNDATDDIWEVTKDAFHNTVDDITY